MQRTKPILKLLENAKLAFSLIDFTASHSNQNHYSQTLRILSRYRWFDLSSKITKNQALNQAEDFELIIFSMLCWFLYEACCVSFASSVVSSGTWALCWSAWQRVEQVAKSIVFCFSRGSREVGAYPSSLLPLVSYLFLLPSILFLLLMLNFPIHSQGNPLPAVWKPQQSNNLLLNEVLLKVEKGNICGAVYLDLTKAFDIVDHEILMSKLSSVGVSPPVLCSGFLPTWLIKNSRNPLWQWIIRSSSRYFRGSTRKHLGTVIVPYVYQRATCCYWIFRGIIVCWRDVSLMLRQSTSTAGGQVECRSLQPNNAAKSEQSYLEPFKDQSTLIGSNRKLS